MNRENPTQTSRAPVWILSILISLILYVLSAGPVASLVINDRIDDRHANWLIYLYAPVIWLSSHPPLDDVLGAYAGWWVELLEKEKP